MENKNSSEEFIKALNNDSMFPLIKLNYKHNIVDKNSDKFISCNKGFGSGNEKEVLNMYQSDTEVTTERINAEKYDFIQKNKLTNKTVNIELKKQQNTQWFCVYKYHNMTTEEKNIILFIVIHNKGMIIDLYSIKLGNFIDLCCNDPTFKLDGWEYDELEKEYLTKLKYKTKQNKTKLNMKDFIRKYSEHCIRYVYNADGYYNGIIVGEQIKKQWMSKLLNLDC